MSLRFHESSVRPGSRLLQVFLAVQLVVLLGAGRTLAASSILTPGASSDAPSEASLRVPAVGTARLSVLAPTVLELNLIQTAPTGQLPAQWNFVSGTTFTAPTTNKFSVSVNGSTVSVSQVGFKRRALFAPDRVYDLRISSSLYLTLAQPIADGNPVSVTNPDGTLWPATTTFATTTDPLRYSPVIHVNQEGYIPDMPKKAMVGFYLGSMGELTIPASTYQLLDTNNAVVFSGALTARKEAGYNTSWTPPYQKVMQADFSAFTTPGRYRLQVPGVGTSYRFVIDPGLAADYARAYALGMFHKRCGSDDVLPFTRFTRLACHLAPLAVPDMTAVFAQVQTFLNTWSNSYADAPYQTAVKLSSVAASLFQFNISGTIDGHGGHHDAGDYSRYTLDCAQLIHHLCFTADNVPGAAALDNLGLPESGDGKSDLLYEASWEADFLARLQDADGGFPELVYPRDTSYEWDVTADKSTYPQSLYPKNTLATAAATAALAQMASSPTFNAQYPVAAAKYAAAAQKGWQFL